MVKIKYPSRHDAGLRNWADVRETSIEIAQAIFVRSKNDLKVAESLWSQPSESEKAEITELAFQIQYTDFPDPELQDICLYWGEEKVFYKEKADNK